MKELVKEDLESIENNSPVQTWAATVDLKFDLIGQISLESKSSMKTKKNLFEDE